MDIIASLTEYLPRLLPVYPFTLFVFVVSAAIGLPLAVLLAAARVGRSRVLSWVASVLISFVRSNPAIINLLLVYYGLPMLLALVGVSVDGMPKMVFAVVMLSVYHACALAEVLRGGYLSVDARQKDAAASVGMTRWQTFRHVTAPQTLAVVVPAYVNALIDLLSDTSVLFVIGLIDIMTRANAIIDNNYGVDKLPVYLAVGLLYWATVIVLEQLFRLVERRVQRQGGDVIHAA